MTRDDRRQRLGTALVLAGLVLLFFRFFSWMLGWPLFILVPGAALLLAAAFGGRASSALFIPGSVVTTIGMIFLMQNAAGYFESWAYVWALIPASVGVGLRLYGGRIENSELVAKGERLVGIFATAFVIAAVFFEALIFGHLFDTWFFRRVLPLPLIAVGVFLLLREEDGVRSES